jgi:hypothetical protein
MTTTIAPEGITENVKRWRTDVAARHTKDARARQEVSTA